MYQTFENCKFETQQRKIKIQKGVIRTNCLDCLDRTGIVQSEIALSIAQEWCESLEVSESDISLIKSVISALW